MREALEYQWSTRVSRGRDQHGARAEQLAAVSRDVDADERRDTDELEHHASQPAAARPLAGIDAQGENRDHERHRGDDDRRQRRIHILLSNGRI